MRYPCLQLKTPKFIAKPSPTSAFLAFLFTLPPLVPHCEDGSTDGREGGWEVSEKPVGTAARGRWRPEKRLAVHSRASTEEVGGEVSFGHQVGKKNRVGEKQPKPLSRIFEEKKLFFKKIYKTEWEEAREKPKSYSTKRASEHVQRTPLLATPAKEKGDCIIHTSAPSFPCYYCKRKGACFLRSEDSKHRLISG